MQRWENIAQLPEAEGYEYSALASYRTQVIMVGGRSKVRPYLQFETWNI
jgi:hypothetical protein